MTEKIKIKISNKQVYVFLVVLIVLVGIVTVNAVVSHTANEIEGLCLPDGTDSVDGTLCSFLNSYYTQAEVTQKFDDIEGACGWDGWDILDGRICDYWQIGSPDIEEYDGCFYDVGFEFCKVPIDFCSCDPSVTWNAFDCCATAADSMCQGTWGERRYCVNTAITSREWVNYDCQMQADTSCEEFQQ